MSIELAEIAFRHASTQDTEDALAILFEGLQELVDGLQEELADLREQVAELKAAKPPA